MPGQRPQKATVSGTVKGAKHKKSRAGIGGGRQAAGGSSISNQGIGRRRRGSGRNDAKSVCVSKNRMDGGRAGGKERPEPGWDAQGRGRWVVGWVGGWFIYTRMLGTVALALFIHILFLLFYFFFFEKCALPKLRQKLTCEI